MYRPHGFQDENQLLETLVKDDNMTFFPEFNLLAVTSSPEPFHESMSRETAIFNVKASEISSGKFFEGFEYVSELVFDDGRDKAFAVIDSFDWDANGSVFHDRRMHILSRLFSWSPTIDAGSVSDMVHSASYYQKHLMSDRESFELSHGKPLPEMYARPLGTGAKELLDRLTLSETINYFPEFNLLVVTTEPTTELSSSGFPVPETAIFNVFPSELAYGKLFHGFENASDIFFSGPVVDPIHLRKTFLDAGDGDRFADLDLRSLAMLLSGSDVITAQSVPALLEIMADRFDIEPAERVANAQRARAEECIRTGVPDIQVEIESTNDDNFIRGRILLLLPPEQRSNLGGLRFGHLRALPPRWV